MLTSESATSWTGTVALVPGETPAACGRWTTVSASPVFFPWNRLSGSPPKRTTPEKGREPCPKKPAGIVNSSLNAKAVAPGSVSNRAKPGATAAAAGDAAVTSQTARAASSPTTVLRSARRRPCAALTRRTRPAESRAPGYTNPRVRLGGHHLTHAAECQLTPQPWPAKGASQVVPDSRASRFRQPQ